MMPKPPTIKVRPMHIPDLVLDPNVVAVTGLVGAGGLVYCIRKTTHQLGERTTVLMGTMSAFVFAAQMVNFPVGLCSGHLLGGVLASALLGPWAGAVVIAAVLLVQCFLFADGGITALGANFINMGLVGAVGGYAIYAPLRRLIGGQRGVLIAAMVAAWFSVILASGAFAIELAASGHWSDFSRVLSWMVLVHAAIGIGEAVITGFVVRFILVRRPDLFEMPDDLSAGTSKRWGQDGLAGLGVALAVAIFLSPFAYDQPDGLEFVGEKLHFLPADEAAPPRPFSAPLPDYELRLPGLEHVKLATAAAGLVGTLVVFSVAWGMAKILPGRRTEEATSHAI
jgi:cobalt/nickel transport system permease protein